MATATDAKPVAATRRVSGLSSVMREQRRAAAAALLAPPPGIAGDGDGNGGGGEELDEEDVWAAVSSSSADEDGNKSTSRGMPPAAPPPPLYPSSVSNGRRSWMDAGLGLSSLSRGSGTGPLARVTSSSRMIPQTVVGAATSSSTSSISSSSSSIGNKGSSMMVMQSAPVNVPDWSKLRRHQQDKQRGRDGELEEEEEEEDAERVPPHIMVARSQANTAFSVFEGAGRTLKGRDLSRVRNAVLKQTGFL